MSEPLTTRQRAELKARAHSMEPVVHVGQHGASPALLAEVERAIAAHELIKVKLAGADRDSRRELTARLCEHTGATAVQQVGRILVLWRPRPAEERNEDDDSDRDGADAENLAPARRLKKTAAPRAAQRKKARPGASRPAVSGSASRRPAARSPRRR